jgi:hypothetical protein
VLGRGGSAGGRPVGCDRDVYRRSNVIERAFDQPEAWRGIATRYEEHTTVCHGALVFASILVRPRHWRRVQFSSWRIPGAVRSHGLRSAGASVRGISGAACGTREEVG